MWDSHAHASQCHVPHVAAGYEDKTAYAQCIFAYTPGKDKTAYTHCTFTFTPGKGAAPLKI